MPKVNISSFFKIIAIIFRVLIEYFYKDFQNIKSAITTVKIRDSEEFDFIEVDLDTGNTSFESFKEMIHKELGYNKTDAEIVKIRKLPNVLIRNTNDIKRLKESQEIEIIFKKLSN